MAIHFYNNKRNDTLFYRYVKAICRVRSKFQNGVDPIELQQKELISEFKSDFDVDIKSDCISLSIDRYQVAHITFFNELVAV